MALHPDFPKSPHAILDPGIRWFPADEAMRESGMEKLMPPLVAQLRRNPYTFRRSWGESRARRKENRVMSEHTPFRWLKAALVPLMLAALAACATPFNAKVSRFQNQLPVPQG